MEKANPQIEYLGFRDGRRAKALVCRGEKHYCEETEIPRVRFIRYTLTVTHASLISPLNYLSCPKISFIIQKSSMISSGPPSVLQMTPTTTPNSTAQMMNLFPFAYGPLNPLAAGIYGVSFGIYTGQKWASSGRG